MSRNLDRTVWAVLIIAFILFCGLIVGTPLSVRSYLFNATVELTSVLEMISGTILIQGPGDLEPIGVSMADPSYGEIPRYRDVTSGSIITTDSTSRVILTFQRTRDPNEEIVLSTVQLYNNTRVKILDSHSPRFDISPNPDRIVLSVETGQVRIATTHLEELAPHVEVRTPQGQGFLEEGSYSIRVTTDLSEVIVRFGEALVEGQGTGVRLSSGQRTRIAGGQEPGRPMPAAQNLIVNGNFVDPLAPSWQVDWLQATADAVPGKAEIVTSGGRKAIFFSRMGKDGIHTETGISQVINRDVLDFESLVLRLDVKLLYQSLSGGGYLSSEFPIIVRIDFKDIYGIDRFWIHGFYYQNVDRYPILPDVWGQPTGEQIPHSVWYPYESGNLLAQLGDVRPARIHSIRIYASGWNFQSMVSEVGLIAE